MSARSDRRGLPGGIVAPAVVFVLSLSLFAYAYLRPGELRFPYMSPGGVGVLGMASSFFWLLAAIGKRPPNQPR